MRAIFFAIALIIPFLTFGQSNIDELTIKKQNILNQINMLKDSIKNIDSKMQNIEDEKIRASIKLSNFTPIKAKNNVAYSTFYKSEDMINSYRNISFHDYVNIIGISSQDPKLAKIEYDNKLGFALLADLEISASDKKIIDAFVRKIMEEKKKADLEKQELQKKANELKQKNDLEAIQIEIAKQKEADAIREKKEIEDSKIAKAKKITREKVVAEKRKEEEFKSNEAEAKRKEEIIRIYGNTIGTRLLNSEIWIGMTDDMAKISLGSPSKNNRTVMASKISEQWVYYNKYLYFDNGILTAWQEN